MSLNPCKHGAMVGVVNNTIIECQQCAEEARRAIYPSTNAQPRDSGSGMGALERAAVAREAEEKRLRYQKQRFEFIRGVIGPIYAELCSSRNYSDEMSAIQAFSRANVLWNEYYTRYQMDVEGK